MKQALLAIYFIILSIVAVNFITTTYLKKDFLSGLNPTFKLILSIVIGISILGTIILSLMPKDTATKLGYFFRRKQPNSKNSIIFQSPDGKFILIDKEELELVLKNINREIPQELKDKIHNYFHNQLLLYKFNSVDDIQKSRFFRFRNRNAPLPPNANPEQSETLNKIYQFIENSKKSVEDNIKF